MLYLKQHSLLIQRVIAVLLIVACLSAATSFSRSRKSLLGGSWFPANPQAVYTAVRQYTEAAPDRAAPGKMVACIVPHAQMSITGPLAAPVFKQIVRGAYDRVIVLSGFHYGTFHGASMPAVQFYDTPLGTVPVDGDAMRELTWNPLIVRKSLSYDERLFQSGQRVALHEREHAIEAVLPYVQAQLGTFRLVPIVVGELDDYNGRPDASLVDDIARSIRPLLNDRTLLICATHLTQYGTEHRFTPFTTNVQENIRLLDMEALQYVSRRDVSGFVSYLEKTGNPVDGSMALAVFMRLLPKGMVAELVRRTTTAQITGNDRNSVSMAAVAFYDPALPVPVPTEIRPDLIVKPEVDEPVQETTEVEALPSDE